MSCTGACWPHLHMFDIGGHCASCTAVAIDVQLPVSLQTCMSGGALPAVCEGMTQTGAVC